MKRIVAITVGTVALAACNDDQIISEITAACSSTPKGSSARVTCFRNHPAFSKLSSGSQNAVLYARVLTEQVEAGRLSKAQAEYLLSNKVQEVQAAQAAQRQEAFQNMQDAGDRLHGLNRPPQTITCQPWMGNQTQCTATGR